MANFKLDIEKEPEKTTVSLLIDVDIVKKLEELEKQVNKSKSELVREILRKVIFEGGNKK